ncbi:hypothetical protein SAICODRAFT_6225 [Saitoella complicata NRRL Y-17804]|uniref:DNA damage-binding protein 1 n=1 Tax=Saitoella complicata (strain BCRC 22490 / CBS 7301 / JCM 7358 / NBRC 10748 / NRRL Y-17804) TaxID=698492 RepID=A0A0E9N820_SAICN|nr:uncharacterized protein SAICODRAFT_6225 [Saitoella complicata NRRL Y-17804]ODQ54485.1 hypothetical protein SAICODRAFT_6225 [Saitoella complicata NRRL Y-17804]GAO45938.1 hypothetical protein G7K_0183-t1 [Saitoella complicata NRRL Y-17804]
MAAIAPDLFLYSLTLLPPTQITNTIIGQFSGQKTQEIIISRGSRLELLRPDPTQGKVHTVLSHDVFGIIRSLRAFRLAGGTKDYIIVGSDSGRIVILEYNPQNNKFVKLHQETFGKTGVRRVVPGQYLATDPKGRACMVASVEKNKLVYVLNRDAQANLTISSPLEAHKANTLMFASIGLDVGYENPIFACLEVDYGEVDQDPTGRAIEDVQKTLVYYELDLGLNHVVRRWNEVVERSANLLLAVPGGTDGPSGVLVCSEDSIVYRHHGKRAHRIPIPRRQGALEDKNRKRLIVAGVMHKMRGAFFYLLQTEDGDLFKVTLDHDGEDVQAVRIKYFDTVPVASGLVILKSGFLFVAAEASNHYLYQFEKLGDDDNEIEFTSADSEVNAFNYDPVYFQPRGLDNLLLVDEMESMSPILDAKVLNLGDEDAPQIYTICGRGARSTFRALRHGLDVSEIVASDLPAAPTAVWTTKLRSGDVYDAYIVLSFTNGTLVLSIGETVEEVTESGFLSNVPTIAVQQLGDDALVQIHPRGIRHIRADGGVSEWPAPQHRTIVQATTNTRQIVVALSSGELVYFELDTEGALNEYQERKEMSGTVTALAVGEVPEGRQRYSFLAVACDDSTVRIISLDPDNTLESLSVQALSAPASALCIISQEDSYSAWTNFLHIGLYNGVYLRTVLDPVTGQLTDTRTRFLGSKPVKLFNVGIQGQRAVLALSSRSWLGYTYQSSLHLTPLSYEPLEFGWSFSSEQCPEGIVGVQGSNLRIFTIERLNENLKQTSIPLTYTPRRFVRHPTQPLFYTVESDHGALSLQQCQKLLSGKQNGEAYALPPAQLGLPKAGLGKWASCISVLDPAAGQVLSKIELEDNEAAFSVCTAVFKNQSEEPYLIVGAGKDLQLAPRSLTCGYIHVYRFKNDGRELELVHKTKTDEVPMALISFQGRLLAGVGKTLRIYDIGKLQLLRKCELLEAAASFIVRLQSQGSRIVISDIQDSVSYAVYKYQDNRLIVFADDTTPRWVTAATMVDYDTVAGGDKFGNFWVERVPKDVSEEADKDSSGATLLHQKPKLQGAPHKLHNLAHVFVNDIPTSVNKAALVAGGRDVLLTTGMMGSVGVFAPFQDKADIDFFQQLEGLMRTEDPPLAGRDHLMYRGYYVPVKSVVDGDLCERFALLPNDKKQMIAGELDRTVAEVQKKIEDMRIRYAF